jgi:SAM-dependent methyltransferase
MPLNAAGIPLPLSLEPPEAFARLHDFFRASSFDEATLCRELKLAQMSELGLVQCDSTPLAALAPRLRWCIEVLARGLPVSVETTRAICGAEIAADFISLGLLRPLNTDPARQVCPVWVYPVAGFIIASDRPDDADGGAFAPTGDEVFPANYPGTLRFLQLLPQAQGGETLDLCGGCGVGALQLARTAGSATTTDITERAAHFAQFNARLNQVTVSSLCGDLYAPVAGRQFDVITAHPPFVPSTGEHRVFRDGGDTGEVVIRRTIEGLVEHLRPGGVALVVCVARDTEEGPFEQRARRWLGAAGGECDVVFGLEKILTVDEVVASLRQRDPSLTEAKTQQLRVLLGVSGTRQFVSGALWVRREAAKVADAPARFRLAATGRATDFARVLDWRHHCRQPGLTPWLAASRPRLAPGLQLAAHHRVHDGKLVLAESVFSTETVFPYALRVDNWVVPLVAQLNGQQSLAAVFDEAWGEGRLPKGFPLMAFADLARKMIEHGLLEVDFAR